ncbi:hypothetical protein Q5425_35665 [Amycolatopsis sp. A133]|uniref:hypothetical protein n=1 Tax=Amycolatopsis sp. A133 TaxID=3064472 RepID=UPI0027E69F3F|nr:hypothetical protein [Amycolatopsis sp. A133]MDQ7809094.1 hypothetical protein [Amycolatopsis sp. A133]
MGIESSEPLLLKPSARGQLPTLGVLAAFLVFEVVVASRGLLPTWVAIALPAVFVVALAIGVVSFVRSRGKPWQVRLGADGVEARGFETVPWSALAEVRVRRLRPRWFFILQPKRYRVIAFVPREPGAVPSTVVFDVALEGEKAVRPMTRWRTKLYGSPFLVLAHTLDATPDEIVDAVRRLSDVPVSVG